MSAAQFKNGKVEVVAALFLVHLRSLRTARDSRRFLEVEITGYRYLCFGCPSPCWAFALTCAWVFTIMIIKQQQLFFGLFFLLPRRCNKLNYRNVIPVCGSGGYFKTSFAISVAILQKEDAEDGAEFLHGGSYPACPWTLPLWSRARHSWQTAVEQ